MPGPKPPGEIVWHDLTVDDAAGVADFYRDVVGWEVQALPMPAPTEGDEAYADYVMCAPPFGEQRPEADGVAGVCHARGTNTGLPAQWLVYVRVADLDAACATARGRGGEVVYGPRAMGSGRLAVVRDPAGAVLGLWQDATA